MPKTKRYFFILNDSDIFITICRTKRHIIMHIIGLTIVMSKRNGLVVIFINNFVAKKPNCMWKKYIKKVFLPIERTNLLFE